MRGWKFDKERIYNYVRISACVTMALILQCNFAGSVLPWFWWRTGSFKNVPPWPNLGVRLVGWTVTAHLCSRVLTADFPFISLWIRYYLLAPAYQSLFAACGLLCTGAYSLLQRRSVLLPGRGSNRARRPCFSLFFLAIFSVELYFMSFFCYRLRTPC